MLDHSATDASRTSPSENRPGNSHAAALSFEDEHFSMFLPMYLERLAFQARDNGYHLIAADILAVSKRAELFFRHANERADGSSSAAG